jgi:DNA-binding response OmpR family regulator
MSARHEEGPVLIAEDDAAMLTMLRDALSAAQIVTIPARSARVALDAIGFHRPPVALIDLAMEDGRGWELLYAVAPGLATAVLAVDRSGDTLVRCGALTAGADDVIGPPFEPAEVAARARAVGRRQRTDRASTVLRHRDLVIDVGAREVRIAGRLVALTPQQLAILRALCEAGGATLHREQLLARIASLDGEPPSDRAIDLHVSRLRRRLGRDGGGYVEAVYGVGYRLGPGPAANGPAGTPADPVLDTLGEAVLVTDDRLNIVSANVAALALLGRERSGVVGHPCGQVLDCRTREGVRLSGPACIGRAAVAGGAAVRHVRAKIRGTEGSLEVTFSHAVVRSPGARPMLAIELRPHA